MNAEEFGVWQRDEPDLYELIDGQPVQAAEEKQVTNRIFRVLIAAAHAYANNEVGREWLEAEQPELGAKPIDMAAEGWEGVLSCLRHLAVTHPGCVGYSPETAPLDIGPARNLLMEAEHYAAIVRNRREQAAALIAAMDILDSWRMGGSYQRDILGFPTQTALAAHEEAAQERGAVDLPPDVLTCVKAVIAIHATLVERYGGDREALVWLRMSHASAAFVGRTPENIIKDGRMPGLLVVLGFLEATKPDASSSSSSSDRGAW